METADFQKLKSVVWTMDRAELRDLIRVIKGRQRQLIEQKSSEFSVGDKVMWTSRGKPHTGKIERVNRQSITVMADDGGMWRVTPTLLTKCVGDTQ